MHKFFFYIFFIFNLLAWKEGYSQEKKLIDSLQNGIKIAKNDTVKANLYYSLSKAYWGNNPEKALLYAKRTLTISDQIGYQKGIGNSYNSMGAINMFNGNYPAAMDFFNKSLEIRIKINDKRGVSGSHNNIGNTFYEQGNFPEALKHYIASLKICEELNDKKLIAGSYITIGNIYLVQTNYPEALKNYSASLKLNKELGYDKGTAECYGSLGNLYLHLNNSSEALKNMMAALKIFAKLEDKMGTAITYINIGEIYSKEKKYEESLKYYFDGLKIYEEIGDKDNIANIYNCIGRSFTKLSKYKDAESYLKRALSLSREIGNIENIKLSYFNLTLLDSSLGNYKSALEDHKLFVNYKDSLINKENTKKIIQQQMQYEFDKKESLTRASQEKKDAMESQKRNALLVGFLVMLVFALVFLRQRNKIAKGKEKSDALLLNILPEEVAEELKQHGYSEARTFNSVTVMFTDFKDFTKVSEKVSPEALVLELHTCFSAFDGILQKYKIEKIKTIGDAYMCVSGMPVINDTHALDMANAAFEIMNYMINRKVEKTARGEFFFEVRVGLNTGTVVAGIVGIKKFSYDIWGDTVNVASRMENSSEPGKINVSGSTFELVKDHFNCEYRGKIQAKNKGEIDMYYLNKRDNLT